MASLFSKKRKQHPPAPAPAPADSSESSTTVATSATDAIYVPTSTSRLAPTFTSLGIPAPLTKALSTLSIRTPSPVQLTTIPPILSGSSLIAIASTGSGKTLAFLLPILTRLALDPYGIYAVIMSPTRELAGQINDQVRLGMMGGLLLTPVLTLVLTLVLTDSATYWCCLTSPSYCCYC